MATYFISDIHGEYGLFCKLLEKIEFCGTDVMFVLGDFLDKGKNPIKLANAIFQTTNIKAICGNHEFSFRSFYQDEMRAFDGSGDINSVLEKCQKYFRDEEEKLTWELIDYIEALPYFIETDDYICVHAGVELDANGSIIPLHKQNPNFFVFDRRLADENKIPENGKTILFGHTPCNYSNGTGYIIKTPRKGCDLSSERIRDFAKIRLDNGIGYTGILGCLRLEDMKEFYVGKNDAQRIK